VARSYDAAGTVTARLTADGGGSVARTLVVRHRPAALDYTGPRRGAAGGQVRVIAQLSEGALALAGRQVTFSLGSASATATTGPGGVAETTLTVPATADELVVRFAGDATHAAAERRVPFEIATGTPPVADAGGPYELPQGDPLTLDGSASSEADPGDLIVAYDWDLDGDGGFDDADGAVTQVPYAQVASLVCGGTCDPGHAYPLALRVTDTLGMTHVDSATVTVVRDFGLVVSPSSQPIAPGGRTGFKIDVIDLGFDGPVTLSVQGLPAGFTASFDANPLTPTAATVVQITAPASAPQGDVPFTVVATGGGIRHEAGGEASVTFGLIPVCFGSFTGRVTDRETGQPIAGLRVGGWDGGITAADGTYTTTGVPLGFNNAPQSHFVGAGGQVYWQEFKFARALCGATITVDFDLLKQRTGALEGRVVEAGTGAPLPETLVVVGTTGLAPLTDADGRYRLPEVPLSPGNQPITYDVRTELDGYWPKTRQARITAGATTEQSFELVRICHATLRGGRIVNRQGQPILGRRAVYFEGHTPVETDDDGRFVFDLQVRLGVDNAPRQSFLRVGQVDTPFDISQCGQVIDVDAVADVVTPNHGFVEGVVRDEETGTPIAGAFIQPAGVITDANGRYRMQVFVGNDDDRTETIGIRVFASAYHETPFNFVTVTADETAQQDFTMLRVRYGSVRGTVSDAATGEPIPQARIRRSGFEEARTDAEGRYQTGPQSLGIRNAPINQTYRVDVADYWFAQAQTTLRADQPSTLDFALVKKCAGGRITGRVLNALTRAPIANAVLDATSGDEPRVIAVTGVDGRFVLDRVPAGHNNQPGSVSVVASAPGFITQTKTVTVFCGASIDIDFGPADTVFGTIVGTVTDASGAPVAGAFVGSEFGRSATTNASGAYRLEGVPLGDSGADREWDVTVIAAGFPQASRPVVARANTEVRADFTLGGPPPNSPPVAQPASVTVDEDGGVDVSLGGTDPDGDPLTVTVVRPPRHGTLTGGHYSPDANFHGADDVEFTVSDGTATSPPATVSITVRPVDDPPRAVADALSGAEETALAFTAADLLANDVEIDGEPLSISAVTAPPQATLTRSGDAFTLTPQAGFFGTTSFTYTVTDGHTSDTASVAVEIRAVPRAPVCTDVSLAGHAGEPVTGTLSCTDRDPLTYAVGTGPAHGTVSLTPAGAFTYTPAAGFHGADSFTFRATDGALESTATVRISIAPVIGGGDLAFWGKVALAGDSGGFKVFDITDPDRPREKASVRCTGSETDISVWNKLVFVSGCAPGIRIYDLKDPRNPALVKALSVDCGTKRHTLVPELKKDRVLLYVSTCIVAVPLSKPSTASVIKPGGPGCNDVTVFMELKLAAAACLSEAQLWDISSPSSPKLVQRIDHPGVVWRTASFTWDGRYAAFGLEDCAVKVYSVRYRKLVSRLTLPRACTANNLNFITTEHHYKLVGGFLAGGTSVANLSDPYRPKELAHYPGDAWASYWYNGRVYSSDTAGGLRVFKYPYPSSMAERLDHLNPQTQMSVID
jgi:protocatechuate 3,4-dioxygenase beta subunit